VYGIGVFGDIQLWIYDIKLGASSALTERSTGTHTAPVWSPDSERIVFFDLDKNPGLFSIAADGSGPAERISSERGQPSSWSIDDRLAYVTLSPLRIRILRMDDAGEPEPFGSTAADMSWPVFSPDARWIAYTSSKTGRPEVYVRSSDDTGPERLISVDGGAAPLWAPDGRELFFVSRAELNGPQHIMAVGIAADPTFKREPPRLLFEDSYAFACPPVRCYDISPDGERFVAIQPGELKPEPVTSINIVLNWLEELEERVSAR
jgi:Tol biopolymer transport system component